MQIKQAVAALMTVVLTPGIPIIIIATAQVPANFFCKGPGSKDFRLYR